MKTIVLLFFLLINISPIQAFSGDLKIELKKCAAVSDSLRRLSCYDEIAKELEGKSSRKRGAKSSDLIAEFQGNGASGTRPFITRGGWEIQWVADGEVFQIFVNNSSGDMIGLAANQMHSGKGTSYQARPGKYYLTINALGDWTVRIVAVE